MDQSEGNNIFGPDQNDKANGDNRIVDLIEAISSQNVSAEVKFEVMQRTVATCPKVNMGCRRKRIPSLLYSGSQFTLICHSYFKQEILPHIRASGGKGSSTSAVSADRCQSWKIPHIPECRTRFRFLGVLCLRLGFLLSKSPMNLLDDCHKTKLSGIISWNLIKLAYQVFMENFGSMTASENFNCPTGISPLLFSQLCVFHHNKAGGIQLRQCYHQYYWTAAAISKNPTIYHQ